MTDFEEEFIEMLNLGAFTNAELADMNTNKIEYRKKFGKLLGKSRQDAKISQCYYCGKPCSSFCNSHSVPAFCLKNISVNGDVFYSNALVKLPLLDDDKGVNESGTFHIICRDCDSKIFKEYENPDNYENTPTTKMLAQIAIKNYLKWISKRLDEISLYENMKTDFNLSDEFYEQKQNVNNLDLKEFINGFNRAKKINEKDWKGEYYLFYFEKLDYVVPLAFQGNLILLADFEGNTINDIYNMSPDYHTKEVHICVFPMKDKSVVMMFIDSNDNKRYRKFYKQFNMLSKNDKLAAINYILFCYSEEIYLYKGLDSSIINNSNLVEASRKSQDALLCNPMINPLGAAKKSFDLSRMGQIPNLLLDEYKVR